MYILVNTGPDCEIRDDATFVTGIYTYRDTREDVYTFLLYGHSVSPHKTAPVITTKEGNQ